MLITLSMCQCCLFIEKTSTLTAGACHSGLFSFSYLSSLKYLITLPHAYFFLMFYAVYLHLVDALFCRTKFLKFINVAIWTCHWCIPFKHNLTNIKIPSFRNTIYIFEKGATINSNILQILLVLKYNHFKNGLTFVIRITSNVYFLFHHL